MLGCALWSPLGRRHGGEFETRGPRQQENKMLSFYGESCTWRIHGRAAALLLALFPVFLFTTLARSQEHDMRSMPGMNMNVKAAPENQTKADEHLANKQ